MIQAYYYTTAAQSTIINCRDVVVSPNVGTPVLVLSAPPGEYDCMIRPLLI